MVRFDMKRAKKSAEILKYFEDFLAVSYQRWPSFVPHNARKLWPGYLDLSVWDI